MLSITLKIEEIPKVRKRIKKRRKIKSHFEFLRIIT